MLSDIQIAGGAWCFIFGFIMLIFSIFTFNITNLTIGFAMIIFGFLSFIGGASFRKISTPPELVYKTFPFNVFRVKGNFSQKIKMFFKGLLADPLGWSAMLFIGYICIKLLFNL